MNHSNCIVAAAAAKKVQRVQKKRIGQVHTKTHFYRPHTLELPKSPKYERKSVAKENKMDAYAIIKRPIVTESAMKKIEVSLSRVYISDFCRLKTSSPSSLISVPTRSRSATP